MKSLQTFYQERELCRDCILGEQREATGEVHVTDVQRRRGIMFIDEAPRIDDVKHKESMRSKQGEWLVYGIQQAGIRAFHLAYLTACRSCEPEMKYGTNELRTDARNLPVYRDIPPLPTHMNACKKNLLEEIYLCDPVYIVLLGQRVTTTLLGPGFPVEKQDGRTEVLHIPGRMRKPSLTEAKKSWWRRDKSGGIVWPTEENLVQYTVLPTFSLMTIFTEASSRNNGPKEKFFNQLKAIAVAYEKYVEEVAEAPFTEESHAQETSIQDIISGVTKAAR